MDEVESSSPMGGGECSESPAHLIEPQVELNEGFEPSSLEPNVEIAETAEQYAYGFYTGADESSALRSNYNEGESQVPHFDSAGNGANGVFHDSEDTSSDDIAICDKSVCKSLDDTSLDASEIAMDTSNSGAYDSSCKEEETNYNEMQRTYLTNFFTSDYQKNSGAVEDSPIDPNIERIPLSRFPSIVKVVERAEYETIQILYQLLYQRSAWDTQELLTKRILEFSGFMFGKNSEEYYNREMLLQTLPNSTLVKIGAILCLDHVKNVLSNVGLGRIDLINAILEFLALPKKKTRAPRQSVHRPSIQLNQSTNAPPCGCRNFCLGKFTEKEREHILNYFSQLRQKKKQDAYFFNLIKFHKSATAKKQPRRSSSPDDEESFVSPKKSRDYKYYYKVKIGTLEVDVCKSAFMILHNLKMSTLNHFQARLKKGCYLSKAVVAATVCPPLEGQETPSKEEPKASTSSNAEPSTTELESVKKEAPSNEKEPSNEIVSNSVEHTEEESKDCSVENSVSNSTEESMESMSSKTEDASINSEDSFMIKDPVKTINKKVPAIMVEKIDPTKLNSQKEDTEKKFPVKVEKSVSENDIVEEMDISTKDSTEVVEKVKTEDGIKQKLKDFPMVVKCMDEASEELLIDLHFLLFLSGADSGKSKEKILEFDGYTFSSESEEFDERKEFLQRMSGKLLTDVARAFSLGVMSKREETIENILAFLMKPQESFLRSSPSVPVILSDVELDDIEGFSDSDESITCEVVEKKVECIDLLAEDDDLSSGGEDSDGEKKKKRSDQKASVATPQVETVQTPVTVDAPNSGSVRTLRDFETIRKIVNTHPPEYLVDIYELLYLKKHEPASLREEILDFSGFNFDKTSTDYVKRKQVLDRMLYNNVRRVYNTLIHNSTEVKVFSKPTMINEIFQFLFKLPDHDTSVRPLPPGAKTLMPKQTILPLQKNKPSAAVSAPNVTVTPPSIIPGGNSGKLSDLKRVFQRVACFPCEYLVDVHKLLFMTDCDSKVIRQNIFGFKGFSFGRDSPEFQQRKMYLEYLTFHSLRKISSVLTTRSVDLRNSTKHELASHLTDVLAEYCNTHVETSSIVPTLSSASAPATSTPTTSNSSVEKIVVTPSIEGLQAADSSTSTAANAVPNNVAATKDSPSINSMNIVHLPGEVDKKKQGNWRSKYEENMRLAMFAYRNSTLGLKSAAKIFDVPKSSLVRRLDGRSIPRLRKDANGGPGIMTKDLESRFVSQLLLLQGLCVLVKPSHIKTLVNEFADANSVPNLFEPTEEAAESWYRAFLERHPELCPYPENFTLEDAHTMSIVDARSVNATPTPSQAPRTRKRKSQPTKQIPTDTKKPVAPPPQQAEFADINLPEIEQYRQIYGTNLNVYPNVPTITGIASFGTGVSQPFPQIVPQTVAFPLVPQYIQQPQIVGLQSTAITMPSSIITQVASNPTEVIVPADIEKPVEESKTSEKMEISKSTDLDEEDGDKPLASLIGHPIDSVLEKNINDIVQKTNLQDITMNKVIQKCVKLSPNDESRPNKPRKRHINPSEWASNKRKQLRNSGQSYISKRGAEVPAKNPPTMIYDLYPKFDLSYRKEFIKSTLRTILYKLGNDNQNTKVKKEERDSNSPDCSVTTTDRDNSLPESPE